MRSIRSVARGLQLAAGIVLFSAAALAQSAETADFSAPRYLDHVKFLSADVMEGRKPGTRGIEQAAVYIANQFMTIGLEPAGVDETYFQPFDLTHYKRMRPELASLKIEGAEIDVRLHRDWRPAPFSQHVASFAGPLAFAGFGIEYPGETPPEGEKKAETQANSEAASQDADGNGSNAAGPYNDYDGFDAKGKVLIIFRYEPRSDDPQAKFGGKRASDYSLWVKKAETAAKHGAAGLLIVNPPSRDENGDNLPDPDQLPVWNEREAQSAYGVPMAFISRDLAEELLKAGGLPSLAAMERKIESERKPASADLGTLKATISTGFRYVEARNVIGLLRGSSAPDEYIVIGAHFDHVGKFADNDGVQQIHNGADDNASGTAGVIEMARAIASGPRPRRSVVFMAFSAEEMGLLGSQHYVAHPTIPISQTKAMLNLDMIGRLSLKNFGIYGSESGVEYPDLARRHGERLGIDFKLPKMEEDRYFRASDQASFYDAKVPVLFAFTGVHPQYHQPGDDWELIDADGATKILKLFKGIALELANMSSGPTFAEPKKE